MQDVKDILIEPENSLRTAMERMTRSRKGVLLVVDENRHLIGVLSDGDVRRALLDNAMLIVPVGKVMNTDPILARSEEEAIALLRRYQAVVVPVVEPSGRLKGIVYAEQQETRTLFLPEGPGPAAGRGAGTNEVLALIPARGGSKRIPQKNLAQVAGKSLLGWAIEAAQGAERVRHVLVSTDDQEIAAEARSYDVDVPWLRPEELAGDDASTLDVILHAMGWAVQELDPAPEIGVLLEPTAPLRRPEHIDEAVDRLIRSDADCVMSVCELPHVFNPEEVLVIEHGVLRPYLPDRTMNTRRLRGQQTPVYVPNGLVYAFRIRSLLEQRSLYGNKTLPLVTPWELFLDIDSQDDLRLANFRMDQPGSYRVNGR